VVLFAAGGALRIWPVFVLGHRFSGLVAIQPGHTLATRGPYRFIRHPSYLGLLVNSMRWGLAFRSAVGVLLAVLLVPLLLARTEPKRSCSLQSSAVNTRPIACGSRDCFWGFSRAVHGTCGVGGNRQCSQLCSWLEMERTGQFLTRFGQSIRLANG
jgi:hypothetical protein